MQSLGDTDTELRRVVAQVEGHATCQGALLRSLAEGWSHRCHKRGAAAVTSPVLPQGKMGRACACPQPLNPAQGQLRTTVQWQGAREQGHFYTSLQLKLRDGPGDHSDDR